MNLDSRISPDEVRLIIQYPKHRDIDITKGAVEKLVKPFKKEFKRQLEIEWSPSVGGRYDIIKSAQICYFTCWV